MSNKIKEKRTEKKWESYGTAFWMTMAAASAFVALLGLITCGFALLHILFGEYGFIWIILTAAGAGAFALAVFCLDLFPTWAGVVRTIRLTDARIEGAMSIAQINKYEEREDRRTSEVKDKVQEGYAKVGKDVLATQTKVEAIEQKLSSYINTTVNNADLFKELRNDIAALNRRLDSTIASTNRSVKTLQNDLENIDKRKITLTDDDKTPPLEDLSNEEETKKEPKKKSSAKKSEGTKKRKSKKKTEDSDEEKRKEEPEPDNFNVEDDDLTSPEGDYLDGLEEFGIGAGWRELIKEVEPDPYAGRSQEEDESGVAINSAVEESESNMIIEEPETVEESAEDFEGGGTESYF